jgi:hypothetical protein
MFAAAACRRARAAPLFKNERKPTPDLQKLTKKLFTFNKNKTKKRQSAIYL